MPFRKKAKGLNVRGKHDVKSVKSLSARSNKVGGGIKASGHDAAPVDSGSRRTGPVKRSATVSKRTNRHGDLSGAANSASAQPSDHDSSPLASRDTVGSPSRRTARQTTATDLSARKTAGALSPGGQIRQELPLSKAAESQQATLTPAKAGGRRTPRPVAKAGGTGCPRPAVKLDASVQSGAARSSRSKPADAQGRGRPVKRSLDMPKVGEQAGPVGPQQKRAAGTTAQPEPHPPPTRGAGRAKAVTTTDKRLTREKLAKGKVIKTTQQTKKAAASRSAKQKQVGKKRCGQPLDTEEVSSDATDSSYVVPRGLLQPYRRKDRFFVFDNDVKPSWQEEEDFWSDSESEDISNASISSIIPPAGLLQPYRKKRRLIGASSEDSLSEPDADHEEEDFLARCCRIFGMDMLPNSTTTKAEAISMLVSFVSSRRLPWGALAELVTLVNKLFAPAENVLPDPKALENILSLMP